MIHPLKWLGCTLLCLTTLGCKNEVTDTEGTTYSFDCKSGACTLREASDDDSKSRRTYVTNTDGRVLLVCPAEKAGFDCRPVACDPSTPCGRLGGADFTCENSLCQAPARQLLPPDKLALCLAKTGPFERTPKQLERITLSRACTGDCTLPAACLKP